MLSMAFLLIPGMGSVLQKYECWSASMVATTAWVQDTAREQPRASLTRDGPARCLLLQMLLLLSSWPVGQVLLQI